MKTISRQIPYNPRMGNIAAFVYLNTWINHLATNNQRSLDQSKCSFVLEQEWDENTLDPAT